ncbi:MAG: peptidoglycan-binding protein [Candidatus Ventricola sp.]
MPTKREAMVTLAKALVGCGYVYGATGWICTPKRLEQQARQYPQYAGLIARYGPRWIGLPCYDCAQLTRVVARAAGIVLPSGTSSQWRAQGVWQERRLLGDMPDEAGLFLFTLTGTRMTHAGVSIGGGEEIDARGHAYGVVRRRIEDTTFTHYARLAVDYDAPAGEPVLPPAQETRRTLRRGMEGADVLALQRRLMGLGYSLAPYGADGKLGAVTRAAVRQFQQRHGLTADGVVGPATYAMLDAVQA